MYDNIKDFIKKLDCKSDTICIKCKNKDLCFNILRHDEYPGKVIDIIKYLEYLRDKLNIKSLNEKDIHQKIKDFLNTMECNTDYSCLYCQDYEKCYSILNEKHPKTVIDMIDRIEEVNIRIRG